MKSFILITTLVLGSLSAIMASDLWQDILKELDKLNFRSISDSITIERQVEKYVDCVFGTDIKNCRTESERTMKSK